MKKLCSLLLVLLCAAVFAAGAQAGEMDYTGLLDPYSGMPVETADGRPASDTVQVSDGVIYDQQRGLFLHVVDDQYVLSNVVSGMVVTTPVFISVPDGLGATLYRNGTPAEIPSMEDITESGSYVLEVFGSQSTSVQPLKFTIVKPVTGAISEYRMPDGFRINSLVFNGAESECGASVVPMTEEGVYEVHYNCYKTQYSYSLNITIDHTPPELTLEGVGENGRSHGQVTITGKDSDATATIYYNGEPTAYSEVLTKNGTYKIILSDDADNTSVYDFYIPVYFNTNGVLLILLIIAIIAAAIAYPLYVRKHLRVR